MKKAVLALFLVLLSFVVYAETVSSYYSDFQKAGKIEAFYTEKYFEYNSYNSVSDGYRNLATLKPEAMLTGMINSFGLRYAIFDDLNLASEFIYIFQRAGLKDFNNLQTMSLTAQKNFGFGGAIAGLRVPLINSISEEKDVRLLDYSGRLNAIAGIFSEGDLLFLNYSLQAVAEQRLFGERDYLRELRLSCGLGFDVYDNPAKQSIDFLTEINYSAVQYEGYTSSLVTVIPQFNMKFFNDFHFIFGVEITLNAENIYSYEIDKTKFLTVARMNYVINNSRGPSDGTAAADARENTPDAQTAPGAGFFGGQ